ncbi:OmpA/MotB domain protein [Nitrosococcus halophilus Nc 4]|uniref:OmpA/MotB domain protein n=1 Tax=Nitrosococcus halophilus (strain Nc4) TaxID=472759 RepID=D5C242_NITHN|nr:flagellar motor protein MotD [Nitrosococcus halophilus]ADE16630.1 OmpA/MotB domain protein [Nitrosococcus halophilus Nc 4]
MARRRWQEDQENHERWLVSYADFITLLFAFFVVMYAVSSVNEGKYRVLSESLTAIFPQASRRIEPIEVGGPGVVSGSSPIEIEALPAIPSSAQTLGISFPSAATQEHSAMTSLKAITEEVRITLQPLIDEDLVRLRQGQEWLEVEINDRVLFTSGSAKLEAEAVPVLKKLAKILRRFPNPIQVEGFTDNVPISTAVFPSNWELSSARAASVVHLFDRFGVSPARMAAIGYGQYRPVADNSTPEGRRRNRRVALVILGRPLSRRTLEAQGSPASGVQAKK